MSASFASTYSQEKGMEMIFSEPVVPLREAVFLIIYHFALFIYYRAQNLT